MPDARKRLFGTLTVSAHGGTLRHVITPNQCRAARALINMTQPGLAAASGVSLRTISHFEKEQRTPIPANLAAIQRALETAGVLFTERGVELPGIQEQAS